MMNRNILGNKDNNQAVEDFLMEYLEEAELVDDRRAEFTLTVEDDGNAWIDGVYGEWFDKQETFYADLCGYFDDEELEGTATIIFEAAEERDLEEELVDQLASLMTGSTK